MQVKGHSPIALEAMANKGPLQYINGPTEAWVDTRDGAVFPIAPGFVGGGYDPDTVAFKNLADTETYEDLIAELSLICEKRPDIKIILTVSPRPQF